MFTCFAKWSSVINLETSLFLKIDGNQSRQTLSFNWFIQENEAGLTTRGFTG